MGVVSFVSYIGGVMPFAGGKSGNKRGRPKGSVSGRAQLVAVIDRICKRSKNLAYLDRKYSAILRDDPEKFFKEFVLPLLPKDAKSLGETDGIVEWKSLLGDEPGEQPRFDAEGKPIPGR